jgi:hypothetical protein
MFDLTFSLHLSPKKKVGQHYFEKVIRKLKTKRRTVLEKLKVQKLNTESFCKMSSFYKEVARNFSLCIANLQCIFLLVNS